MIQDIDDKLFLTFSWWGEINHKHRINVIEEIQHTALPMAVYAKHVDRSTLLGYAYGASDDIYAYFDDRKAYGLEIELIKPVRVPKGYATKKAGLLRQKKELEAKLAELDRELKGNQ